jgi:hypothetical protein
MYDGMNGAGWKQCNSTIERSDPCSCASSWGVGAWCSGDPLHIKEVSLDDFNVRGFLVEQIGDLSQLTTLSMHGNQASAISLCTSQLTLTAPQIGGTLPIATLSKLSALTTLSLSQNQMTGSLPSSIADLKQVGAEPRAPGADNNDNRPPELTRAVLLAADHGPRDQPIHGAGPGERGLHGQPAAPRPPQQRAYWSAAAAAVAAVF